MSKQLLDGIECDGPECSLNAMAAIYLLSSMASASQSEVRPGTRQAKRWVSLKPGYPVRRPTRPKNWTKRWANRSRPLGDAGGTLKKSRVSSGAIKRPRVASRYNRT